MHSYGCQPVMPTTRPCAARQGAAEKPPWAASLLSRMPSYIRKILTWLRSCVDTGSFAGTNDWRWHLGDLALASSAASRASHRVHPAALRLRGAPPIWGRVWSFNLSSSALYASPPTSPSTRRRREGESSYQGDRSSGIGRAGNSLGNNTLVDLGLSSL